MGGYQSYVSDPVFRCSALHAAVSSNELDAVKKQIEIGADFYSKDHLGRWPVHLAYATGNDELIRLLEYHTYPENRHLPDHDPFEDQQQEGHGD